MAQLKDTLVQGSAKVTDTLYTNKIQISQVLAPTASNGATFGAGTNNNVLKSNGTLVFWGTLGKAEVGLGNVENTALSSWAGSTNITKLGTITSGTWHGSTLGVAYGGTGATSFTANSVIISGSSTTAALTTRAIDDATANGALGTGTGLTTERSVYYGLVTVNNASQTRATGIYAPTTGGTANTQALVGNGATTAPKWVNIAPSSAWTAGTTSGPVLKITVLGQTESTGSTIPSASISASGIVTTGGQAFKGRKVFGYMTRKGYDDSGNATRYIEDTYLQNNAGTAVGEHWYDVGDPTNITMGKFSWREYSPNSTANTATTGYHETYSLPAVTAGLTANASYSILTTKSAVTVAQGGTGKTSWTQWGVLYASATTTLANTAAGTAGYLLQGNGSAAPSWIQATNANTANTVVKRDSSGNFSAGTITATLSGTATTATKLGSSTVGGTAKPIYLNDGTPTAISDTVGTATKPVYLNAGTITVGTYELKATVNAGAAANRLAYYSSTTGISSYNSHLGTNLQPIYLYNGVPAACKQPVSGDWSGVPSVRSDGVMEIGAHVDFHTSTASTNDYDFRISMVKDKYLSLSGCLVLAQTSSGSKFGGWGTQANRPTSPSTGTIYFQID